MDRSQAFTRHSHAAPTSETYTEVEIGAWVRRRRRKRILIAMSGVLLLGLAYALYVALQTNVPDVADLRVESDLRCVVCSYQFTARLNPGEPPPAVCPKCHQKTVRELWSCRRCGNVFVRGATAAEMTCPKCKSSDIGSAASARKRSSTTQPVRP